MAPPWPSSAVQITVDGDTSTNDTVIGLASGTAGGEGAGAGTGPLVRGLLRLCGRWQPGPCALRLPPLDLSSRPAGCKTYNTVRCINSALEPGSLPAPCSDQRPCQPRGAEAGGSAYGAAAGQPRCRLPGRAGASKGR